MKTNTRTQAWTTLALCLFALAALFGPSAARAQTYTYSTLHSFTGNGANTDGAIPQAGLLLDSAGNLFGTTLRGGTSGQGTVFEIPSGGATLNTLYSFSALSGTNVNTDGANPVSSLVPDGSGDLFGTTRNGGAGTVGTVFDLALSTKAVTTLHAFTGSNSPGAYTNTDGASPEAGLARDSAGNLFGTTYGGGANGAGTIFKIAANTTTPVTLHSFTGTGNTGTNTDGVNPFAGLVVDGSGNLFGTTNGGGNGTGTVFEFATSSSTFTTLHLFTGSGSPGTNADGAYSNACLAFDAQGNLFGTTQRGGTSGNGTVFELTKSGATYTYSTLHSFAGNVNTGSTNADGAQPFAGLVADGSGNLYGTTFYGGTSGLGTVFEVAAGTNAYTTLYSFTGTGADGINPQAPVVRDSRGNLFGTTTNAGAGNQGTVFQLSPVATQSAHTYVSHAGTDTGTCSRSAPCRRFDYALSQTAPGGTITALNAGDYGSVFIQQAVTIDGEGTQASVVAGLSHTSSAITISAAAGDAVILRGLTLNGAGGGSGLIGVSFQAGGSLVVDHCAFSGFGGAGLDLETGLATVLHTTFTQCATGVQISGGLVSLRDVTVQGGRSGIVNNAGLSDIKDSLITQNSQFGVIANNGSLSVSGCTLSGNRVAAQSAPNATLRLTDNNLWNNGTGLNANGGIISTTGNNRRAGNSGTKTPIAPTDQPNRGIAVQ